jgi:hypothetical protein
MFMKKNLIISLSATSRQLTLVNCFVFYQIWIPDKRTTYIIPQLDTPEDFSSDWCIFDLVDDLTVIIDTLYLG